MKVASKPREMAASAKRVINMRDSLESMQKIDLLSVAVLVRIDSGPALEAAELMR